jgi:hypothetical protein
MNAGTQPWRALEQGDPHTASRLLPLVYDELRKLATERMGQEPLSGREGAHSNNGGILTALMACRSSRTPVPTSPNHQGGPGHVRATDEALRDQPGW